jgi:Rieske Fe-S protein
MIENACNGCAGGESLDRRTFLARSTLAAVALALAACNGDASGPEFNGSASIKVSDYAALANVNGVAALALNGAPVAVVRTGAASFIALSRVCPHQGSTVNTSSGGFTCPNHGARFNLSGTWIGGQQTSSLRSYATSYDAGTDMLTIG